MRPRHDDDRDLDPPDLAKYERWIAEHRLADSWGKCDEMTKLMAAAFPELRRERGHYVCPVQGRLPHWWLVAPGGRVVDPTRDQFASAGGGRYEPHVGPEPTGRCLCCGQLAYGDEPFCSATCREEFAADFED